MTHLHHLDDPLEQDALVTPSLVRCVVVGGIGSLLFGFDTGVVSGALLVIGTDLGGQLLEARENEIIVSSALVGALLGSLIAARLADWWGRKKSIILAAVLFALGALEQAAAQVLREVVLGRILVGLGVGLASQVLPIYLAELSPQAYRGRVVGSLVALITGGQVLAYVVDAVFFPVLHGWRYMFGFGALPALIQLLLSFSIPESPRYEILKGRVANARSTFRMIYPLAEERDIQSRIEKIQNEIQMQEEEGNQQEGIVVGSWWSAKRTLSEKLWKVKPNRRALVLAMGLQFFQQAVGSNGILYYSGIILESAHFSSPLNFALIVAVANFICTIIALRLIDHSGRRPLLLYSIPGVLVGQFLTGLSFLFIPSVVESVSGSGSSPGVSSPSPSIWAYVCLASMILTCCTYAFGLGITPWVVQSEVLATEVRSLGTGFATATNWVTNLIVASSFLSLSRAITSTGVFWIFALMALVSWIFAYLYLPETKGLSLEETRPLFESDLWANGSPSLWSWGRHTGLGWERERESQLGNYTALSRRSGEDERDAVAEGLRAEGEGEHARNGG